MSDPKALNLTEQERAELLVRLWPEFASASQTISDLRNEIERLTIERDQARRLWEGECSKRVRLEEMWNKREDVAQKRIAELELALSGKTGPKPEEIREMEAEMNRNVPVVSTLTTTGNEPEMRESRLGHFRNHGLYSEPELVREIDRLKGRVAELESAQWWFPVSERLPENGARVFVYWNSQVLEAEFCGDVCRPHFDTALYEPEDTYVIPLSDNPLWKLVLPSPPDGKEK